LLTPLHQGHEVIEEAFQAWQQSSEDGGINVGIGQQFVPACGKATVHRLLLSEVAVLRKSFVRKDLASVKEGPQLN
jgi:hypothetical protein